MPLDEVALASGTGLIPPLNTIGPQTPPLQLKLGPAPMTDKLKEQVSKTLQDEDEAAVTNGNVNGHDGNGESAAQQNGHEANGDVEMSEPNGEGSKVATREQSPTANEVKLEPDTHSDLISPAESETNPPVPGIFRIADLKREVEAVRDRRRMMRLGGGDEDKSTTPVLPSVLAMTVFDGGLK
jgi:transcription initiation factor TFIID subunit 5